MEQKQTFANHVRYDAPFHFFLLPVFVINVIVVAYYLFRFPGLGGGWLLILSATMQPECRTALFDWRSGFAWQQY
jgi:hypothetical protein